MKKQTITVTVEFTFLSQVEAHQVANINYIHSLLGFPSNKEHKILLFNVALGSVQKE